VGAGGDGDVGRGQRVVSAQECPFIVKGCEKMICKIGDSDAMVRQRASEAVLKVASGREDVVDKVRGLLTHQDSTIRKGALQVPPQMLLMG
jgi:hypothetical protein